MSTPTPAEKAELANLQAYLRHHAATDFKSMPTTIAALMNRASPNVRAHMKANKEMLEHVLQGGRSEPFQPPLTIDASKVDKTTEAIAAKARTEEWSAGLMERLGTPSVVESQQSEAEPDRRETLSAAFDQFSQQE